MTQLAGVALPAASNAVVKSAEMMGERMAGPKRDARGTNVFLRSEDGGGGGGGRGLKCGSVPLRIRLGSQVCLPEMRIIVFLLGRQRHTRDRPIRLTLVIQSRGERYLVPEHVIQAVSLTEELTASFFDHHLEHVLAAGQLERRQAPLRAQPVDGRDSLGRPRLRNDQLRLLPGRDRNRRRRR